MFTFTRQIMAALCLLLLATACAVAADDTTGIAGPPLAVGYAGDGPVRIRFSSYLERTPLPDVHLLNLPPTRGRGKTNLEQMARIDADEGMVYTGRDGLTTSCRTC